MTREAITILHISDMQFGKFHRFTEKQPGVPPNEFDTLTQRLILDLDYLIGRTRPKTKQPIAEPDLIICSGDLAEWGMKKEFDQAFEFLGKIAKHLKLTRDRVIVIPGNHDINRKQCQSYFGECDADERPPVFPWFPKWKQFKEAFDKFYHDSPTITFTPAEPWTLFEIKDLAIVVAGLNSTMDEGHDEAVNSLQDKGHHGFCTESQLRWFQNKLDDSAYRGWLRIGTVHHNIVRGCRDDNENLRDAYVLENILGQSLDFVLHGHTHHAKSGQLKHLPVYSTGSASLKTHDAKVVPGDVPNQYQIITLKRESFIRHGRRYNSAAAPPMWIGDTSLSETGDDWIVTTKTDLSSALETLPESDEEFNQLGLKEILHRYPDDGNSLRHERTNAADLFLDRVAELTRLRFENAQVQKLSWLRNDLRCLNISYRTVSGILVSRPLASALTCPTADELDALRNDIVSQYRAVEPRLFADCICGDDAALTEDLRSHANACGVRFQRIGEYRGLIDLTSFVEGQTQRIERLQAAAGYRTDWYVNQRMTIETGGKRSSSEDALTTIAEWMQQPEPTFVLLLGEPGTGKTFLTLELARRLAVQPCIRPILVELRRMEKSKSVAAMLGAHFADHMQSSDPKKLSHMISEGAVTLLFDGFDELALRVGYARATDHLKEIIEAAQGDAPHIIVTSRTSHFESDKQVRNRLAEALQQGVRGLRYCHVLPFEPEQIETYLQKRFKEEANAWMQLLKNVEDLIGLSRIPRMLAFITSVKREMLEQACKPETGTVSAGDVYWLVIVDQWLPFEHARMNQLGSAELFTQEQMLEAVRHLAQALWKSTDKFISLAELSDHAHRILEKFAPDKIGQEVYAAHQLGSGTLLMRDADGRFTFIHQSIMEWLVAEQAAGAIGQTGGTEILHQNEMSSLMADFLIDMAGPETSMTWAISIQREDAQSAGGEFSKPNALLISRRLSERYGMKASLAEQLESTSNEAVILNLVGAELRGRDLNGEEFAYANMTEAKLSDANLSTANLKHAWLINAELRNTNLSNAILNYADLTGADLFSANLTNADLRNADLTAADLTRATFIGADLRGAVFTDSQWTMARLAGTTLDDPQLTGLCGFGAGLPRLSLLPMLLHARSEVLSVTWSPNGELIASGYKNGSIILWDSSSGECLRRLEGHPSTVWSVAFSPDGSRLASGSHDKTLRVWDSSSGECLGTLKGHSSVVRSVAFSPDGSRLASGSDDKTLRVWDSSSGQCLRTLEGNQRLVMSVSFSPDGSRLASGSDDKTLRVWETSSGQCLRTLKGHSKSVNTVAFSPDGSRLASGSDDKTLRVWDSLSGQCLRTLEGHAAYVMSVSFSPDGSRLASGSSDKTLRVWDTSSGQCLRTLEGHQNLLRSVAFSLDGRNIASGSDDKTFRLWDSSSGQCLRTLEGHLDYVSSAVFSPDGSHLVSGSFDNTLRVWDSSTGECLRALEGHSSGVSSVAFSQDGNLLVSGSNDRTLRVWDSSSGKHMRTLVGHVEYVSSVAFSSDGSRIASGSYDQSLRVWDSSSGQCLRTLQGHRHYVNSVAFSRDGSRLASGSFDKELRVWDSASGQCLRTLEGHQNWVRSVAFSPDGSRLASGSDDKTLRVWDSSSGQCLRTLEGHQNLVMSVAFSPDGSRLASGSYDNTLRVWDSSSGQCLRTLEGHSSVVTSVAFWSRGPGSSALLVSSSEDGTVRIWNPDTGDCLGILLAHGDAWAALRPDGRYRVVGDMTQYLWHISALARYELGELDTVYPELKLAPDEPLIPSGYFQ